MITFWLCLPFVLYWAVRMADFRELTMSNRENLK